LALGAQLVEPGAPLSEHPSMVAPSRTSAHVACGVSTTRGTREIEWILTSTSYPQAHERLVSLCPDGLVRSVVRPRPSRNWTAKPAGAGFLRCAEEDSNLHPVIPDQALNRVAAV
jgi:hypothetical protein